MSKKETDPLTLERDSSFDEPLRRVSFEAGMLLGLEATRSEQDYHRRRLNRQQYWLHNQGTLVGLAASIEGKQDVAADTPTVTRVEITPGVAIDGLGREVVVEEPYCLNLGDWLEANSETLAKGYDETGQALWLTVTLRHKDCPIAFQPVLAQEANAGTDPVAPARIKDSVLLELSPGRITQPAAGDYNPWSVHPLSQDPVELTPLETAHRNTQNSASKAQLDLHARLLQGLPEGTDALKVSESFKQRLDELANTLLAEIRITAPTLESIVVNPKNIDVNNLVRPFLTTPDQLAWLLRQE